MRLLTALPFALVFIFFAVVITINQRRRNRDRAVRAAVTTEPVIYRAPVSAAFTRDDRVVVMAGVWNWWSGSTRSS